MSDPATDPREMYQEISTLLGHLAIALDLEPETVAVMLEQGTLALRMEKDEHGIPCVAATCGEGADRKDVRVYKDRIQHRAPNAAGDAGA